MYEILVLFGVIYQLIVSEEIRTNNLISVLGKTSGFGTFVIVRRKTKMSWNLQRGFYWIGIIMSC